MSELFVFPVLHSIKFLDMFVSFSIKKKPHILTFIKLLYQGTLDPKHHKISYLYCKLQNIIYLSDHINELDQLLSLYEICIFTLKLHMGCLGHVIYILPQLCCMLVSRGSKMTAEKDCLMDINTEKWQEPLRFHMVGLPLV